MCVCVFSVKIKPTRYAAGRSTETVYTRGLRNHHSMRLTLTPDIHTLITENVPSHSLNMTQEQGAVVLTLGGKKQHVSFQGNSVSRNITPSWIDVCDDTPDHSGSRCRRRDRSCYRTDYCSGHTAGSRTLSRTASEQTHLRKDTWKTTCKQQSNKKNMIFYHENFKQY